MQLQREDVLPESRRNRKEDLGSTRGRHLSQHSLFISGMDAAEVTADNRVQGGKGNGSKDIQTHLEDHRGKHRAAASAWQGEAVAGERKQHRGTVL